MSRAGCIKVLVVVASTMLLSGHAEAQTGQGLKAGWGGVDLLAHPIVRHDLKLDGPQLEKAKALASDLRDRQKSLVGQLEGLAEAERIRKSKELAAVLAEEEDKGLADLLRPDQLARFRQVDLQQRGASAWLDPKVAEALELTSDQSLKLVEILNRSMVRRREAQSNTRGDRRATTRKIEAIRKETDAQAIALLTSDQVATWKTMTGEPLDLNPIRTGH